MHLTIYKRYASLKLACVLLLFSSILIALVFFYTLTPICSVSFGPRMYWTLTSKAVRVIVSSPICWALAIDTWTICSYAAMAASFILTLALSSGATPNLIHHRSSSTRTWWRVWVGPIVTRCGGSVRIAIAHFSSCASTRTSSSIFLRSWWTPTCKTLPWSPTRRPAK